MLLLARSWPATAVGPLAAAALPWRLERRRGVAVSPRPFAGPEPRARPSLLSLHSVTQAERDRGPVVLVGRPSSNRKDVFGFSFIIWEEKYFGKMFVYSFLLQKW